ncbi:polysaccharide deacetylase family protein [Rubrobacter marinus]|uniref:Polysaccharide deacetylase family protein n=1 Tax=Rubrobacter marinus TaxID=2653852 RepID=A0A6G8PXR6_9ACTN|nr:polysaccharide deacetylase family protein [Rubrobacter marinus]QIN78986.1 polysaccharide deacetylase family protein [Rubrobacter marinus]
MDVTDTPGVALTFDDGPDPVWTPRVLDALDRAGARATFFVIPPLALEHEGLVRAALEAGHGVELHCVRHVRHTELSPREVEAEAREGLRALRSFGAEPRLWRPPWGVVAPWTWGIAAEYGLEIAGWTADTHDWRGDDAPAMLRSVSPLIRQGAVVLMHDGIGPGALRDGCAETVALVGELVAHIEKLECEPSPYRARRGA